MEKTDAPEPTIPPAEMKKLDTIIDVFEAGASFYNRPREENEIDLVKRIREAMIEVGLKDKVIEAYDENRFIKEAEGRTAHAQQYNLNRYFSTQLMAVEQDTSLERYALLYEIRPDQWLEIFKRNILPIVVNCDLPVKL